MKIDHLFVLTDAPAEAAQELLAFGLTEGSCREHPGQGTANRKFYFENCFLEILWVRSEAEITSPLLLPTRLWERARYAHNGASPYGLCLENTPDTEAVFAASIPYQPLYFPAGLQIDVLPHEQNLNLPWTFRLPFKGEKKATSEPTQHRAGLQELTCATFGIRQWDEGEMFVEQLANQPQLQFVLTPDNTLTLTFDKNRQGKTTQFNNLNLTICY